MSIYNIANSQFSGQLFSVSVLDRSILVKNSLGRILFSAVRECHGDGTGMFIMSSQNSFLQHLLVMHINSLWISHDNGNPFRHSNFVNLQIRVRTNDCSSREVDSFTAEISSESSLFSFQTLCETALRFCSRLSI